PPTRTANLSIPPTASGPGRLTPKETHPWPIARAGLADRLPDCGRRLSLDCSAGAEAGREGPPVEPVQMGSVAEGLEQGDRLVVVVRNLDLDAVHVGGPPAVPEHLVPRGLDIDQQVVDRRGPGEGGQQ